MSKTKHATTNFKMLIPFVEAAEKNEDCHAKFVSGGYMPFSVEYLGYEHHGAPVFALAHYGELNGDLMADPDMTVAVDEKAGTVEPLTYQNDYVGIYQAVYVTRDGHELWRPALRTHLDNFLWDWLKTLNNQGFSPDAVA